MTEVPPSGARSAAAPASGGPRRPAAHAPPTSLTVLTSCCRNTFPSSQLLNRKAMATLSIHFPSNRNTESSCCTTDTTSMSYVNYASINKYFLSRDYQVTKKFWVSESEKRKLSSVCLSEAVWALGKCVGQGQAQIPWRKRTCFTCQSSS